MSDHVWSLGKCKQKLEQLYNKYYCPSYHRQNYSNYYFNWKWQIPIQIPVAVLIPGSAYYSHQTQYQQEPLAILITHNIPTLTLMLLLMSLQPHPEAVGHTIRPAHHSPAHSSASAYYLFMLCCVCECEFVDVNARLVNKKCMHNALTQRLVLYMYDWHVEDITMLAGLFLLPLQAKAAATAAAHRAASQFRVYFQKRFVVGVDVVVVGWLAGWRARILHNSGVSVCVCVFVHKYAHTSTYSASCIVYACNYNSAWDRRRCRRVAAARCVVCEIYIHRTRCALRGEHKYSHTHTYTF